MLRLKWDQVTANLLKRQELPLTVTLSRGNVGEAGALGSCPETGRRQKWGLEPKGRLFYMGLLLFFSLRILLLKIKAVIYLGNFSVEIMLI